MFANVVWKLKHRNFPNVQDLFRAYRQSGRMKNFVAY